MTRRAPGLPSTAPNRVRAAACRLLVSALISPGLLAAAATSGETPRLTFTDLAREVGITVRNVCGDGAHDYIVEANGNGPALLDFDDDGDLDVLLVSGSTLEAVSHQGHRVATLYMNHGDWRFSDVTVRTGLTHRGWGMGGCAGDYDGDGDLDVYLTAFGPNLLYRNNGDGTFTEVAVETGVADARWSHSCAFGDYDRDRDLDLYVTNYVAFDSAKIPPRSSEGPCEYLGFNTFCGPLGLVPAPDALYRNGGDGTFAEVAAAVGAAPEPSYAMGVVFSDLDADGWLDLFVTNDSQANYLLRNRGDGSFEEQALLSGVALNDAGNPQASMGIAAGDYDGDGRLDLFLTNFSQDYNTLYRNHGPGLFSDASYPAGIAQSSMRYLGWGAAFADFDHDGRVDLFVANGHVYDDVDAFEIGSTYLQPDQFLRNLGDGKFRDATAEVGLAEAPPRSGRGAAFGDLEGDGDLDAVIVNMNAPPTVLRNELRGSEKERHWIRLASRSQGPNRQAIGARVILVSSRGRQTQEIRSGGSYLSQSALEAHFGLGSASVANRLEVAWPSGARTVYERLPANHVIVLAEAAPPR